MLVEKQKKTISDLLQEKEKLTSTIFDMKVTAIEEAQDLSNIKRPRQSV
jgi:hypothetical protein